MSDLQMVQFAYHYDRYLFTHKSDCKYGGHGVSGQPEDAVQIAMVRTTVVTLNVKFEYSRNGWACVAESAHLRQGHGVSCNISTDSLKLHGNEGHKFLIYQHTFIIGG